MQNLLAGVLDADFLSTNGVDGAGGEALTGATFGILVGAAEMETGKKLLQEIQLENF